MADIFDLFRQIQKKEPEAQGPIGWLIVGLGNPGDKYRLTRHNTGFLALDYLSQKADNAKVDRLRFHALCGEATVFGARVLFMKPQTLMNASGTAVGEAAAFYHIPPEHVLVISDDITLPVGRLRVRKKGSAGGHNGLKDIILHLNSDQFPRIRVGIGEKPHPDYDLADWVLSEFSREDRERLFASFGCIWNGLEKVIAGDFDTAMQTCNSFLPEGNANA